MDSTHWSSTARASCWKIPTGTINLICCGHAIKRDIKNMLMHGTILTFIKLNNFGIQCLTGPGVYSIYSAVLATYRIFKPMRVCTYMSLALIQINMVVL